MLDYYSSIEPPEDIVYHQYEEEDTFRPFNFDMLFADVLLDNIDETLSASESAKTSAVDNTAKTS